MSGKSWASSGSYKSIPQKPFGPTPPRFLRTPNQKQHAGHLSRDRLRLNLSHPTDQGGSFISRGQTLHLGCNPSNRELKMGRIQPTIRPRPLRSQHLPSKRPACRVGGWRPLNNFALRVSESRLSGCRSSSPSEMEAANSTMKRRSQLAIAARKERQLPLLASACRGKVAAPWNAASNLATSVMMGSRRQC